MVKSVASGLIPFDSDQMPKVQISKSLKKKKKKRCRKTRTCTLLVVMQNGRTHMGHNFGHN